MTVYAIGRVKDEHDIVFGWVRHLLDEVDYVIVADNASTDGTRELLEKARVEDPDRLTVLDDSEPGYYQSAQMSELAEVARRRGATWIVPADADELWYSHRGRIREALAMLPDWWHVVRAPIYDHRATGLDPAGPDPFITMQWRERSPLGLRKVAFRAQEGAVVEQGNHGVQLPDPGQVVDGDDSGLLVLRHFPVRSPQQMVTKAHNGAAAYRAAPDLPEDMGAHWRAWGRLLETYGPEGIHDAFREHWWRLSPVDAGLVHDPAPYLRWREEKG
jgi:hypothetical protein